MAKTIRDITISIGAVIMPAAGADLDSQIKEETKLAILEQIKIIRENNPRTAPEARLNLESLLAVDHSLGAAQLESETPTEHNAKELAEQIFKELSLRGIQL